MLRVAKDLWKFCAFFNGAFYRDERMHMGRVASTHSGQRTSQLITAVRNAEIASRTDHRFFSWLAAPGQSSVDLEKKVGAQAKQSGNSNDAKFQDDLSEIAVGGDMEELLASVEMETLNGEL